MYDLALPAERPGTCPKCKGTGVYSWGHGRAAKSGACHSCRGTGRQTSADITRNRVYNRHKLAEIIREG